MEFESILLPGIDAKRPLVMRDPAVPRQKNR